MANHHLHSERDQSLKETDIIKSMPRRIRKEQDSEEQASEERADLSFNLIDNEYALN